MIRDRVRDALRGLLGRAMQKLDRTKPDEPLRYADGPEDYTVEQMRRTMRQALADKPPPKWHFVATDEDPAVVAVTIGRPGAPTRTGKSWSFDPPLTKVAVWIGGPDGPQGDHDEPEW